MIRECWKNGYLGTSLVLSVDEDVLPLSYEMVLRLVVPVAFNFNCVVVFMVLFLTLILPPGLVPMPRINIVTASRIRFGSTQNKAKIKDLYLRREVDSFLKDKEAQGYRIPHQQVVCHVSI